MPCITNPVHVRGRIVGNLAVLPLHPLRSLIRLLLCIILSGVFVSPVLVGRFLFLLSGFFSAAECPFPSISPEAVFFIICFTHRSFPAFFRFWSALSACEPSNHNADHGNDNQYRKQIHPLQEKQFQCRKSDKNNRKFQHNYCGKQRWKHHRFLSFCQ